MPDLHQPESGTVIETGEFQMNAAPVYKKQMSDIDDVALLDLSTCGVTPEYALEISGGACGLDRQWAVPSFKLKKKSFAKMGAAIITEVPIVPVASTSSKAHTTVIAAPGVKVTPPFTLLCTLQAFTPHYNREAAQQQSHTHQPKCARPQSPNREFTVPFPD
ncbi:hypothetical protein VE00_09235 [Pseudogymnoascus sp. WSF 3629]|nr:hypothetical protein VE00_09235 [Pseudogymnoascus sp. WSF 3629]